MVGELHTMRILLDGTTQDQDQDQDQDQERILLDGTTGSTDGEQRLGLDEGIKDVSPQIFWGAVGMLYRSPTWDPRIYLEALGAHGVHHQP